MPSTKREVSGSKFILSWGLTLALPVVMYVNSPFADDTLAGSPGTLPPQLPQTRPGILRFRQPKTSAQSLESWRDAETWGSLPLGSPKTDRNLA